MIYFFTTAEHAYTMRTFADSWEDRLRTLIEIVPYSELIRKRVLKSGACIFADIERLSRGQARALEPVWQQMACQLPAEAMLNHPNRSMSRYELLKYAYDHGINDYNVYWVSGKTPPDRYPVFVRQASEHNGNLTPLLNSADELSEALAGLPTRGKIYRDLMIAEFCDVSDNQGIYRKYAAFRVGESIVPRHLFFSRKWMQKFSGNTDYDETMLAEERDYLENNPHEEQLKNVFDAAGLRYGRIDYGLSNGRIQVWEINTNPMLVWADRMADYGSRRPVNELFLDNILTAFGQAGKTFAGLGPVTLRPSFAATKAYDLSKCRKLGLKYTKKKVKNHTKYYVKKALGLV